MRCQFSLTAIFALVLVIAMVLTLCGGAVSEPSLLAIWLMWFGLSYCGSQKGGWAQIAKTTTATAAVWATSVTCAYAFFIGSVNGVLLASHGFVIVLAGTATAFVAACFVEAIRWVANRWSSAIWLNRFFLSVSVILLMMVAWEWVELAIPRRWDPMVVRSRDLIDHQFDNPKRISQIPDGKCEHVTMSADGNYCAALLDGSMSIRVFDTANGKLCASFDVQEGEWFGDLTFRSDGKRFAAILCSKSAEPKLVGWDLPKWTPCVFASLSALLDGCEHTEAIELSLDRVLLFIKYRRASRHTANAIVSIVDLYDEKLVPQVFAEGLTSFGLMETSRIYVGSPNAWIVAANRRWIATSGKSTGDQVFYTDSAPIILPGCAIGLLANHDSLGVIESSWRCVWKDKAERALPSPPLWNRLLIEPGARVLMFDCNRKKVMARSCWFNRLVRPQITLDQERILTNDNGVTLAWEVSDVRQ